MRQPQSAQPVTAAPIRATRGPWQTFWRELAGVMIFNTLIALGLRLIGFGGTFAQNFVFSQCIGLSIAALVDGGRRVIWREGVPPMGPFLVLVALGCLGGLAAGVGMGTALLGLPMSMWRPVGNHSVSIVLAVALAGTGIGTYHGWSRARLSQLREAAARQALREASVERQLVLARLKTLQAQLEPHFLFNVLANLDALIASDAARARMLLAHLNRFLRASLAATRAEVTSLADEFVLLDALLAIQQVRFGERLRYAFDLPDDCRALRVPPMLVQPLVENALKHGVEPLPEGAAVHVEAWLEASGEDSQHVVIRVADDGAGFHADTGADGVGLMNIRERLRVRYGDAASLTLAEGVPRGVVATLRLPTSAGGPADGAPTQVSGPGAWRA